MRKRTQEQMDFDYGAKGWAFCSQQMLKDRLPYIEDLYKKIPMPDERRTELMETIRREVNGVLRIKLSQEPFENTLTIDELRREVREGWDTIAAINKYLLNLPDEDFIPSIMQRHFYTAGMNVKWCEDSHERARILQREFGSENIPFKSEYEYATGLWDFIHDAVIEKLERERNKE